MIKYIFVLFLFKCFLVNAQIENNCLYDSDEYYDNENYYKCEMLHLSEEMILLTIGDEEKQNAIKELTNVLLMKNQEIEKLNENIINFKKIVDSLYDKNKTKNHNINYKNEIISNYKIELEKSHKINKKREREVKMLNEMLEEKEFVLNQLEQLKNEALEETTKLGKENKILEEENKILEEENEILEEEIKKHISVFDNLKNDIEQRNKDLVDLCTNIRLDTEKGEIFTEGESRPPNRFYKKLILEGCLYSNKKLRKPKVTFRIYEGDVENEALNNKLPIGEILMSLTEVKSERESDRGRVLERKDSYYYEGRMRTGFNPKEIKNSEINYFYIVTFREEIIAKGLLKSKKEND